MFGPKYSLIERSSLGRLYPDTFLQRIVGVIQFSVFSNTVLCSWHGTQKVRSDAAQGGRELTGGRSHPTADSFSIVFAGEALC